MRGLVGRRGCDADGGEEAVDVELGDRPGLGGGALAGRAVELEVGSC